MLKRLVSLWVWFSTGIVAVVWLPWLAIVWLFTAPRDPGRYAVGRWFRLAAVTVTGFIASLVDADIALWPMLAIAGLSAVYGGGVTFYQRRG